MDRQCECCKAAFSAKPADVARGWGRFCSKSCAKTKPAPVGVKPSKTHECERCKKLFRTRSALGDHVQDKHGSEPPTDRERAEALSAWLSWKLGPDNDIHYGHGQF